MIVIDRKVIHHRKSMVDQARIGVLLLVINLRNGVTVMRRPYRTARNINRHIRRGVRRSFRRRGNLLGLVGMAALGYGLYEKHQREQQRNGPDSFVDDVIQPNWDEEIPPAN